MTEVYQDLVKYLGELEASGINRWSGFWTRRDGLEVTQVLIDESGGLDLSTLDLGLTGVANLALYDGPNQTQFSIVIGGLPLEAPYHHKVSGIGESRPKLRLAGKVQEKLGGPEEVLHQVVLGHITHIVGDEKAKQIVKPIPKGVIIGGQFKLEVSRGRDIHGKLTKVSTK